MMNPIKHFKAAKDAYTLSKKGAFSMNQIIGVIVGVVALVGAAIPVTTDVISSVNVSGTTGTILGLVPLFLAIGAMVMATFAARK